MAITLPENLRDALARAGGKLLLVEDPATHRNYVLLPEREYERLQKLLSSDDDSVSQGYAAQDAVARAAGWDDPIMEEYNDYDSRKKTA